MIPIKITVLHQYRRSKKISFIVREDVLNLREGKPEETVESEATILKKEIESKLRKKIEDSSYEEYESVAKKL